MLGKNISQPFENALLVQYLQASSVSTISNALKVYLRLIKS